MVDFEELCIGTRLSYPREITFNGCDVSVVEIPKEMAKYLLNGVQFENKILTIITREEEYAMAVYCHDRRYYLWRFQV